MAKKINTKKTKLKVHPMNKRLEKRVIMLESRIDIMLSVLRQITRDVVDKIDVLP